MNLLLSDHDQYLRLQKHWETIWKVPGWETPWMKSCYADGTAMLDGNPFFTSINHQEKRGVRLILSDNLSSEEFPISYWFDTFGEKDDVVELVISCRMSHRHRAFLAMWYWAKLFKLPEWLEGKNSDH